MGSDDSLQVGQVSSDDTGATITFRRHLRHPPEAVWDAITDPAQLAKWYMQQVSIDGRLGGSIDFISEGGRMHATGRILAWDPPRLLEYEWKVRPQLEIPLGEDTVVRWELKRDGNSTVLTLKHRNLTQKKAVGAAPFTHVVLERLVAHLDGHPFQDFPKRVAEIRALYMTQHKSGR